MYTKRTQAGYLRLIVHVDDIFLTSPTKALQQWCEGEFSKGLEITRQYDNISYLGLKIATTSNGIKVTQDKHLQDIITKYKYNDLRKYPKTPMGVDSMQQICKDKQDKSEYLSLIMSLMYFARFTRPDILHAVSCLASRSSVPTVLDYSKALRVVKYLAGKRHLGLFYGYDRKLNPEIYADASHIAHETGHGHGGILLTLDRLPVFWRSFKLKTITRSSSESELVVLDNAVTYAIWFQDLLGDLGYPQSTRLKIHQDNKSTIIIAKKGGTFKRTKHMLLKEAFIRENIEHNRITLVYCPSDTMAADFLTKPVSGGILNKEFLGFL